MTPQPDPAPIIEFRHASYSIPASDGRNTKLLHDITLRVPAGETLALLGRSGAGKTTALKLINRLLETTEGEVHVEGKSTRDWDPISLRRRIGYVIQETGLFPHYTVAKNVALIPKLEGWPSSRTKDRVDELLNLVGLDPGEFRQRYPHQLSGGQRQRVGVARALAADPAILLMDEPFGALDPLTRGEIRNEFQQLQRKLRKTVAIVTHEISEALLLGTRIGLLDGGKLAGIFSPSEFVKSNEPSAAPYIAQLRELERAGGNA